MNFHNFYKDFQNLGKEVQYLTYFLLLIIFLSYIIPTILFLSPSGTDAYTHMYNTLSMADSNSLLEFYEKSFREEYLGYDYPFGLWHFGSIVMKVTGIDIHTIAYILPLILMMISILLYYIYANNLLQAKNKAILSVIFLISMPLVAIGILNYSTSRFVSVFLIAIIFLSINKLNFRNLIITSILIFSLVFSHAGTYIFLMFLLITYFILSALIWRQFDKNIYISIVCLLFLYVLAVNFFPFVQPQYIDKGRLVLSISESISSHFNLGFVNEMGKIFYDKIFVSNNLIYVLFWSCFIFAIGKLALYIHSKFELNKNRNLFAIPLIRNISHSIETAPLWLGPLHTLLSLFGATQLNYRAKCLGLSLILVAFYPGALQSGEGTGALREIYYLYLIIPITSAAGFYYVIPKFHKYNINKTRKAIVGGLILLFLLIFICTPIIGNMYYQPMITGTKAEKENLMWLSKIGNPWEGASGFAYRERIDLYANKVTPSIPSGSEMKRYLNDLKNIYFSFGSEEYAKDLYSFNIKYIISSDRTLKGFGKSGDSLRIDSNKELDKIYSSTFQNFSIYKFIIPPKVIEELSSNEFKIEFEENNPKIQDFGSIYLIENDFYKVKLSTATPKIKYIGTKTSNFLGEGDFSDFITISWRGTNIYKERYVGYSLDELNYSILVKDNKIIYKTVVRDGNDTENWATLIVKYIFYEKAIKREIIIANDWVNLDSDLSMNLGISNLIFAPITDFEFNQIGYGEERIQIKKIYPSQDAVILKDKKFNEIYFNESGLGIFIKFSDSSLYPSRISYRGSTIYEYGGVSIDLSFSLSPSEPISLIQYFSVGDKPTAKSNIERYISVSPYFYSEAKIPVILIGYIDEFQTEYPLNVYKKFQDYNVTYTEAVTLRSQSLIPTGINPIGYVSPYGRNVYKNLTIQNEEIKEIKEELNIKGILFKYFKYNLDTIKVLSSYNILFAGALTVPSPFFEFFREGLRNPKIAYYHGEETGVVLIPITLPTSSILRPEYDAENVFSQWKETLDSVVEDGGMAVFLWNAKEIDNQDYLHKILELINYSKSRGTNFTTPDDAAAHFKLFQKISIVVTKGIDYVILNATNYNQEDAIGVTYKVKMPVLNNSCPYRVINGRISKCIMDNKGCVVYVSFDLKASENKEIIVEPNISRKQFKLDLLNVFEGSSYILIRDQEGNPVDKAIVYVDAQRFESDREGKIEFNIRRGIHKINVEKPGFVPLNYEIEVKGRIYKLLK